MDLNLINTFSPIQVITNLPTLLGQQRIGEILTVDYGEITDVISHTWFADGLPVIGFTGNTFSVSADQMMKHVKCVITGSQGTFETPAVFIYHDHSEAGHNDGDDAVLAIIPHSSATHIAVANGDWSSTATWSTGTVPGAGASVLIPHGISITYDVASSPRLDRVRVDGVLTWAAGQSTEMLVETLFASVKGSLIIGTSGARVPIANTHEIIISDRAYSIDPNNPTDIDFTNDPTLMGRGVLWHGICSIWGAIVTPWLRTTTPPMAGATSLTLDSSPINWAIGDTIVIGGTWCEVTDGVPSDENEERVITNISGAMVSWTAPLVNNHDVQNASVTRTDLNPPVWNKKRNVRFRSESPHEDAPHRRGHTMGIHGRAITDIWGASFIDLGRTDKSKPAGIIENAQFRIFDYMTGYDQYVGDLVDAALQAFFEGEGYIVTRDGGTGLVTAIDVPNPNPGYLPKIQVNADGTVKNIIDTFRYLPLAADSNLQSRYPCHMHFPGFGRETEKAVVRDCYVENTPGWGYVHHGGEADFFNNVCYRFVGSGMVSETADELGAWADNLIWGVRRGFTNDVAATSNPKNTEGSTSEFGDFARTGIAMFFRGRAMRVVRNLVGSCSHCYVFFHRANEKAGFQLSFPRAVDRSHVDVKSLAYLTNNTDGINFQDYPIRHFADNEAVGTAGQAFMVTKGQANQNHDLAINLKRLKGWGIRGGAHLEYVGTYNITGWDLVCTGNATPGKTKRGIQSHAGVQQITIDSPVLEGFANGLYFANRNGPSLLSDHDTTNEPLFMVIDPTFTNVTDNYEYDDFTLTWEPDTIQSVTRIYGSAPSSVEPTIAGTFPNYTWDGSFVISEVLTDFTALTKTDSQGTQTIPKVWDAAGYVLGSYQSLYEGNPAVKTAIERQNYSPPALQKLIQNDGYWTYNGDNIVVFPFYFSDRITGRPAITTIGVKDTGSVAAYTNNGAFTLSTTGPTRTDIADTCAVNGSVTIDILTGASLGTGGVALSLFGDMLKPDHGEAVDNGDGTITYTPDQDYDVTKSRSVPDEMFFFVHDGAGRYKTVKVSVTVS